ncbi:hypothetical protein E2C01_000983 [Portunus trituberculatus]|uniref:Uncharacterized protein n=1 Tax=Portunus trituberculatus TaxID=210409 RepID=A0A5B7CJ25_PORTR|nr:hypothetical protein [Portunus trituberculatus]
MTQPYPHSHPHPNHHHDYLHHITFLPRPKPPLPPNIKPPDKPIEPEYDHKPENPLDLPPDQDKTNVTVDPSSYVQFEENPRHHYSYPVVEVKPEKRDIASIKKYQNPDLAIDTLTCITCAQCMLYHCMSDAEGEFAHHPCECGGPGGTADESCGRRVLLLAACVVEDMRPPDSPPPCMPLRRKKRMRKTMKIPYSQSQEAQHCTPLNRGEIRGAAPTRQGWFWACMWMVEQF